MPEICWTGGDKWWKEEVFNGLWKEKDEKGENTKLYGSYIILVLLVIKCKKKNKNNVQCW